ncbi:MAG: hypothetical protein A2172_05285 [Candidatus Woykebacteria bacterium RBG_13_40_15]|uniref:Uncharacterized protein n=1 Tax=Candidatus Woykebacteria bacterium RBG_13_40_15 TaxID=1802593 RepID=A0A1G1W576_9BACT|nr:MAG: hypothetical protein A2172_05285 [Candidatus Woykebacteria bacterium RBG_13_40_15]
MNPKLERKLRTASKNQLQYLNDLFDSSLAVKSSGATGSQIQLEQHSLGGTVSALIKRDLVEPAGREGRNLRVELSEELKKDSDDAKNLIWSLLKNWK